MIIKAQRHRTQERNLADARAIAPPRFPWLQRLVETAAVRAMTRVVPLLGLLISHAFIVRGTKAAR